MNLGHWNLWEQAQAHSECLRPDSQYIGAHWVLNSWGCKKSVRSPMEAATCCPAHVKIRPLFRCPNGNKALLKAWPMTNKACSYAIQYNPRIWLVEIPMPLMTTQKVMTGRAHPPRDTRQECNSQAVSSPMQPHHIAPVQLLAYFYHRSCFSVCPGKRLFGQNSSCPCREQIFQALDVDKCRWNSQMQFCRCIQVFWDGWPDPQLLYTGEAPVKLDQFTPAEDLAPKQLCLHTQLTQSCHRL